MDNISQLQDLWKNLQHDQEMNIDLNKAPETILKKIKRTEKSILRINVLKTITISILLISIIWLFLNQDHKSVIGILSISMMGISIIAMVTIYWRIQFKSSDLNLHLSQNEFVDDAIFIIYKRKQQFLLLFKIFILVLILEMNLLYFDLLGSTELPVRLIYHITLTLFLLLVYIAGLKIRELKFNREFKPLIDDLIEIKKQ